MTNKKTIWGVWWIFFSSGGVVNTTQNDAFELVGDGPSPSIPSTAASVSVPVGVPPGLEYLTQVIIAIIIIFLLLFVYLFTKHCLLKFQIDQVLIHQKVELLEGKFVYTSLSLTIYSKRNVRWVSIFQRIVPNKAIENTMNALL